LEFFAKSSSLLMQYTTMLCARNTPVDDPVQYRALIAVGMFPDRKKNWGVPYALWYSRGGLTDSNAPEIIS